MAQYGFFYDQSRCYGCHACAISCKDWNGLEPGPEKWMNVYEWETGSFPQQRVHLLAFSCAHCQNPACIAACMNDAIVKEDKYGAVLVDQEKCTGCRACFEACPYGAPTFADDNPWTPMSKCTMCIDRLENGDAPVCVMSCPMRAFDFGPIGELKDKYGDNLVLDGMPDGEPLQPAFIAKPAAEKKTLFAYDAARALELLGPRENLPALYDDAAQPTEIPDGLVYRNTLNMKAASGAEKVRLTSHDQG